MIKKIISILLCVIFALTTFSVSVSAEDAEQYDIFLLPLISEKMLEEQKCDQIQVYWDKNSNIPFVSIDEATSIVGGSCNYKTGWYTVDKDYFYFRYNSQDDMKLYLGNSDYGILLLDGNLFESRLIHGRWYVDFFRFCDMFDSKLNKIDLNSYNIQGLDTDDLKSYKDYLKEKKVPFFLYVYNGYSLSTIYKEIMKYKNTYVWDYSKYPETEVCFRSLIDQSGAYTKTLTYNYFSNIVNDWDNVVSVAVKPYKPDEHYTESLINITNVNYPAYAVQHDRYQNYSLTKGDSLYTMLNAYNVIDTFKGDSDAVNFLKNFIDTGNYGKAVDSLVSDSQFGYVTSFVGAGLNTYQSAAQTVKMYKHLDGIDERRIQLLQKGIINNDNLASMAEHDDKIRKAIEKCSVYSLGAISTGIDTVSDFLDTFDVPFNPARYNVRNPYLTILNYSLNNSASLKDSAEKLVNNYQNQTNQLYDILENSGESLVFSISNDVLMYALESNPESASVALVIGIIDGLMSASKIEFGEELKKSELLYQYEYIEQLLLKGLDEKNKENLQTRLTMLLEASLCSYLITSNSSDEAIKDICSLLLTLDDKSDYITYFNDPRNHQSFGNIKELILDYKTERINKGSISGKVLTEDKNPIKNAKIEVYTSSGNQAIRFGDDECYTDGNGEFSISMPEGKYLLVVTHDGYDPVNIKSVTVKANKINVLSNIILKQLFNQEKCYESYLDVVDNLVKQYGEGEIVADPSFENYLCLNGLGVVRLIDFDGDGHEELLCSGGDFKNDTLRYGFIKIYNFVNGKANVIYDSKTLHYGPEPSNHVCYCVENNKILLLTKRHAQTFSTDEWSEFNGNTFVVVKRYSNMPNADEMNSGKQWVYRLNDKIVDKEIFMEEFNKMRNQAVDLNLNRANNEQIIPILDETNNVLQRLGYQFQNNSSHMTGNIVRVDNVYYYLGYDDESNLNLYKGGTDMREKVKLDLIASFSDLGIYSEQKFTNLYTYNSKIYYNKSDNIHCYDTGNQKNTKICSGRLLDINENGLLYLDNDVYQYDLRTNKNNLIKKFDVPFTVYKGFIDNKFFISSPASTNMSLCYIDENNKEHDIDLQNIKNMLKSSISSDSMNIGNFVFYNNKIYFIAVKLSNGSGSFVTDSYLISMNTDGSEMKYNHIDKVADNRDNINYVSDISYIYNDDVYIGNGKININTNKIEYTGKTIEYYNENYVLYTEDNVWYLSATDLSNPRKIADKSDYKKLSPDVDTVYGVSYGIVDDNLLINIALKTSLSGGWRGQVVKYVETLIELDKL